MSRELTFAFPLQAGLHARPASLLAELCSRFDCSVHLCNRRSGSGADAASVLELVSAGVLHGDACVLSVSGEDEEAAHAALAAFVEKVLPTCDEAVTAVTPATSTTNQTLPRILRQSMAKVLHGESLSPGIGIGVLRRATSLTAQSSADYPASGEPSQEMQRLVDALSELELELAEKIAMQSRSGPAEILRATLSMLRDRAFSAMLQSSVFAGRRSAEQAVLDTSRHFAALLENSESAYMRERSVDLRDCGTRLVELLTGQSLGDALSLSDPTVLLAAALAPRQLLSLERSLLAGLLLTQSSAASHAAIIARALAIPCLSLQGQLPEDGLMVIVDAERGLLVEQPGPDLQRFYERQRALANGQHDRQSAGSALAKTRDGRRIEIAANLAAAELLDAALASGAEGIGLLRTELVFAEGSTPPTEEEQYRVFRRCAEELEGRTLIVRSYDIGADKPLAWLPLPAEDNPFLGWRGVRLHSAFPEIFETQLRAVIRASAHGRISLMAPMISSLSEALDFRALVQRLQSDLASAGVDFDPQMQVGMMLEVPSAVLIIKQLSTVMDFFSIGSNDLCQYTLAVDRTNPRVAEIYSELNPAFLRMLKLAADGAQAAGRWLGLCGEMAREPLHLPLLVGLGLDELSMSAPYVPAVRAALAQLDTAACRALLDDAVVCSSAEEVRALLEHFASGLRAGSALLDEALIVLDSSAASKDEALRQLAELLHAAGRCAGADALEDALWAREETYSTGLGHGFAIPHCKSDVVYSDTIALLRPAGPLDWGALDDQPVHTVIMLAIRGSEEGNTHLKILARLARMLMDEGFRDSLSTLDSAAAIVDFLCRELEIGK